jgi:hypothetical protein
MLLHCYRTGYRGYHSYRSGAVTVPAGLNRFKPLGFKTIKFEFKK